MDEEKRKQEERWKRISCYGWQIIAIIGVVYFGMAKEKITLNDLGSEIFFVLVYLEQVIRQTKLK